MTENGLNIGAIHKIFRKCQRLTVICCCVLMLASVAGVSSVKICAYIGQRVQLLSNIVSGYKDVSLYKEDGTNIASWKDDTNEAPYVDPYYRGRIDMDEERNIWLKVVESKDAARYYIKSGIHKQLEIELIVMEICHDTTTAQSKKDDTKGRLTEEQMWEVFAKWLNDHPEFIKKCPGDGNSLIIQLQLAILILLVLNIVFTNWNHIRDRWISVNKLIQERCYGQHRRSENLSQPHHSAVTIEEPEKLTDDQKGEQIQKCLLDVLPMFIEKYLGKLMEDQIKEQIQKGLSVYPGPLFIEKCLGRLSEEQIRKWLIDHPALTDLQDSIEDHHTVSPQVTSSIIPSDFGVDDRFPEDESVEEDNHIDISVKDKISLFEQKSSPHLQPKVNKWHKKNVRNDRCFTSEDPDVGPTDPLL